MAYYLKAVFVSSYHSTYLEAREIEFYNGSQKISISDLSSIYCTSAYSGWGANNLIDGNTSANTGWCNSGGVYANTIIFKSNKYFNKLIFYNDSQAGYGYAVKEAEWYILNSDTDPSYNDSRWILKSQRKVSLGNQYENALKNYEEILDDKKYLFSDGINLYKYDNQWTNVGEYAINYNIFNTYGMDNVSTLTNSQYSQFPSNKIKVLTFSKMTDVNFKTKMNAIPHSQLVKMDTDIDISNIDGINSITIDSTESGNGIETIITSFDSGLTWKTYNGTEFVDIDISDINNVKVNGMTKNVLNSITAILWNNLRMNSNKLRFSYYVEIVNTTDVATINTLNLNCNMRGSWELAIHGTQWKANYASNTKLVIKILESGTWKINYPQ